MVQDPRLGLLPMAARDADLLSEASALGLISVWMQVQSTGGPLAVSFRTPAPLLRRVWSSIAAPGGGWCQAEGCWLHPAWLRGTLGCTDRQSPRCGPAWPPPYSWGSNLHVSGQVSLTARVLVPKHRPVHAFGGESRGWLAA